MKLHDASLTDDIGRGGRTGQDTGGTHGDALIQNHGVELGILANTAVLHDDAVAHNGAGGHVNVTEKDGIFNRTFDAAAGSDETAGYPGGIGVIGPKRMDYKKVIASLKYFASGLFDDEE